ncbi:MAG: regulatory protein RecX [Clostridiales bacterium]|nr:regulatory protein RecX [Clostridiales bacterium]
MIITSKPGREGKIHISADGQYRLTLDADVWYAFGIPEGAQADEQQLAELESAASFRSAKNCALNMLSRRSHGRQELIKKLRQKKVDAETADAVVDALENAGLINDEDYARLLAEELYERKGMSAEKIKYELISRGISREISENTVETLDNNPVERIIIMLNTKYSRSLSDEKGRKRVFDALLRLGYRYSDIRSAFLQCGNELDGGEE